MYETSLLTLQDEITQLEQKLADKKHQLEETRAVIEKQTATAATTQEPLSGDSSKASLIEINNHSPPDIKVALFRSLFKGREDVYAKRFESKTGKSGYQPVCRNEWVRGICEKPRTSCGNCTQRSFEPVTDDVVRNHLSGSIVMGVYPLLPNETCHFLAIDFDKEMWREDVRAFMDTCRLEEIPASLERSRSGNGAHVWIFFKKPVPAAKARRLGSFLMTRTLDRRPEIGLDSFDRFFPNQDTMPKGGFGNLIALPLQKNARDKNHSIFLDGDMTPYIDQWTFLSSIKRLDENKLDCIIQNAIQHDELLPVVYDPVETDDETKPWKKKTNVLPDITEPIPQNVEIVLAEQLYVNHTGLPPVLRNRILRLASFANPEFYQAQKMRLPTWNKPHILYCYEFFPEYIGLPVGCLDSLLAILEHYKIKSELQNKQNHSLYINEDRNKLIIQDILDAHHEGRECLVLSERLEHLDILRDALKEHISSLFMLKGGLGKKQVKTIMEAIQNTPSQEHKVILATGKYLGEGFDLPSLDTLFLVFPFSWRGMLVQYTGRLNRASHGKKEIRVYDYVDEKVPVLSRMYGRRLKGYKALGFTVG